MNKTLSLYYSIESLMKTNAQINFISHLPFLENVVSPLYAKHKLKRVYSRFSFIFTLLTELLGKYLLFLVSLQVLPELLLRGQTLTTDLQILLFIILFALSGLIDSNKILGGSYRDYVFLHYFSFDPVSYYKFKYFEAFIHDFITYYVALFIFFKNPLSALVLTLIKSGSQGLCEIYSLLKFKKTRAFKGSLRRFIIANLLRIIVYLLLLFDLLPQVSFDKQTITIITAAALAAVIAGITYVLRYDKYKSVAIKFANENVTSLSVSISTDIDIGDDLIAGDDVEGNRKYYEAHKGLEPMAYIKKTFVYRFRKHLVKDMLRKILSFPVMLLLLAVAVRMQVFSSINPDNFMHKTPLLISFVLGMTYSQQYTTLSFRNIDLPFLYQHIYSRNDIIKNMLQSLFYIFKFGIVMMLVFSLTLFAFVKIARFNIDLPTLGELLLIYTMIYFIDEIFGLLTYYGLQPYTVDLKLKSPVTLAASLLRTIFGTYVLFSRNNLLLIKTPLIYVTIGVFAAFFLLMPFVDKTFKYRV